MPRPHMTLRRRAQVVTFGGAAGLFALVGIGMLVGSRFPVWLIVAYCVAGLILSVLVRCPTCGKPLNWNPILSRRSPFRVWGWTIDTPRKCSRCNASLE